MACTILQGIIQDKNKFSISNFLTLSRLFFLPFILYHISKGTSEHDRIAALFMFLAGSTDFFDGYLARKYNLISYLGKILDPMVDKISIGLVVIYLTIYNGLPSWYTAMVIGRDVLILCGGIFIFASKSTIVQSNKLGKWTLGSFVIVILAYNLHLGLFAVVCMWISAVLIPLSAAVYVHRFIISNNLHNKMKRT